MYTEINFKTKKAMREAFEAGRKLRAFSPGPFPGTATGRDVIEGPQGYHTWYAAVTLIDYLIVKMDGTKAYWSMKPEAEQEPGDVYEFHPAPPKVAKSIGIKGEAAQLLRQDMKEERRREALQAMRGRIYHLPPAPPADAAQVEKDRLIAREAELATTYRAAREVHIEATKAHQAELTEANRKLAVSGAILDKAKYDYLAVREELDRRYIKWDREV